jgi:penicillin-binding protein 1A
MHNKNRHLLKKFILILAVFFVTALILAGIFFLLADRGFLGHVPDKAELAAISNEEASLVYSSDSILIGKYFAENRTNIRWNEVPAHLKNALIATEDKRFFTHKGYDTWSYFRVFLKGILPSGRSGGGGSTLTQQLVKNLYGRDDFGFFSVPVNKVREIIIATRMEEVYSKEELLLLYLNSVPFGKDVYGVESAARFYFNKPTSKLRIEESAVLVALLKANTYFNPLLNPKNSLARRNLVLSLMEKQKYLSAKTADSLQKLPLDLNNRDMILKSPAGYFVFQVKKQTHGILDSINTKTGKEYDLEKDGLRIYTTLNMQVQELATEAVKQHLTAMQKLLDKELSHNFKKQWYRKQQLYSSSYIQDLNKRQIELFDWNGIQTSNISKLDSIWHYYSMLNAAVLISNPKNGEIVSWIGGNNFAMLPFDMVLSHRQIASAFKPVLYATALENGFTPCTYLQNEEKKYSGYEDWEPKNADNASTPNSKVAFWYALAHSMNLPTVDLYFKVGRENLMNTCERLNFPKIKDDAPSMALGTLDLSLSEIVSAYAAFANKGWMNGLVMINKITDANGNILYKRETTEQKKVFNTETTQSITAILQEAINQGTGTKLRSQYGIHTEIAGKTGTAQNYSDAWFIAYTPDIVVGTWVGARTPDVHFYSSIGSGASLALPIVAKVLIGIEKDTQLRKRHLTPFSIPEDLYSFLHCEPLRESGIKGFFNRLFKGKSKKNSDVLPSNKKRRRNGKRNHSLRNFLKGISKSSDVQRSNVI